MFFWPNKGLRFSVSPRGEDVDSTSLPARRPWDLHPFPGAFFTSVCVADFGEHRVFSANRDKEICGTFFYWFPANFLIPIGPLP